MRRAWLGLLLAALPQGAARGLSLRASSAELVLDELAIGRSYTLAELLKEPLAVLNTGTERAEIAMRTAVPRAAELRDGYEPVPMDSWLRLTGGPAEVGPGEQARGDGVVAIPKDRRLLGGQYQVQWVSQARSESGLKLTLGARLLLRIAPDSSARERARRKARKRRGLEFRLAGGERAARQAALGRRVDLKAEHGVALKLVNPNAQAVTFALRPAWPRADGPPGEEGFEPAPNPGFLKVEPEIVKVSREAIKEARLVLAIPDQARYRGRRWVFAVEVELLEAEEEAAREYRLYVQTR